MSVFFGLEGHEALLMDGATVLAVLAAFALWPIPSVRWLAAAAALFLVLATLTTGWHSGVVTLAGALLALVCCRFGLALTALESPRLRVEVTKLHHG
jgi:hypothetical protein